MTLSGSRGLEFPRDSVLLRVEMGSPQKPIYQDAACEDIVWLLKEHFLFLLPLSHPFVYCLNESVFFFFLRYHCLQRIERD